MLEKGQKMNYAQEYFWDRRESPRIDLETQITIKSPNSQSLILAWIENISCGGFKLKADIPLNFKDIFHIGDIVSFETYEDFFMLKGSGEVRWTSPEENEAGIKFEEIDPRSRKFLNSFLRMFS